MEASSSKFNLMGKKDEALRRFREAKEKGVSRSTQLEDEEPEEDEADVYRIVDEEEYGLEDVEIICELFDVFSQGKS